MAEKMIIKVHANESIGFWVDSNHTDDLPKPQFSVGETVTYENRRGDIVQGKITFAYTAQDMAYLLRDKSRTCWHYGIEMCQDFPETFRTEWELLEHNPRNNFKIMLVMQPVIENGASGHIVGNPDLLCDKKEWSIRKPISADEVDSDVNLIYHITYRIIVER